MRRSSIALALVAVLACSAAALASAASLPKLFTAEGPNAVRPPTINYTGDGSGIIGELPSGLPAVGKRPGFLRWETWTHWGAFAVGTLWIKTCQPDCAASPFLRYAVRVSASRPRRGHFTRLTLTYTYRGKPVVDRRCTPDSGGGWAIILNGRCV